LRLAARFTVVPSGPWLIVVVTGLRRLWNQSRGL